MDIQITSWQRKFVIKGSAQFCECVVSTLEIINKTKLGRDVINMLLKEGGVDIDYMESSCVFMPKGSTPCIRYDPYYAINKMSVTIDPTIRIVKKKQMTFIYLYHELVHAARSATGQFIGVKETNFLDPKPSPPEEYTVVGLYEYAGYGLSENAYRKSLGLPRRPYYFTSKEDNPLEYEGEVKRRMFLKLPDSPKFRQEELVFQKNRFNQKIDEWKLGMYIALDYKDERKEFPYGYPEKGPVVPQDWTGAK